MILIQPVSDGLVKFYINTYILLYIIITKFSSTS